MTAKKNKSGRELIKSLHDVVCGDDSDNAETMPLNEVYSYLKKNDIDPDQLIGDVQSLLSRTRAKVRLDEAREKRESLLEKMDALLPLPVDLKGSVKFLIDTLMTERPQLASAYYRKYESATEKDLESLYQDLLALQQLDENDAEK